MIQIFEASEVLEIGEIQILAEDQSRGIGYRVLRRVINDTRRCGKSVRLRLALKNHEALRLYLRLGFRQVGCTDTHYHLERGE